jgi:hypothetical protein
VHKDSYEKAIKKFIQEYRNLPRTLGVLGLGNVGCAVAQIDAYKEGVPGNGEPFPDGAKMAKIHWNPSYGTPPHCSNRLGLTIYRAQ